MNMKSVNNPVLLRRVVTKAALATLAVGILPSCASSQKVTREEPTRRVNLSQLDPQDAMYMVMALRVSTTQWPGDMKAHLATVCSPSWGLEVEVMRRTGASETQIKEASIKYFDDVFGEHVARWRNVEYRCVGKFIGGIDADMQGYKNGALTLEFEFEPFDSLENAYYGNSNGKVQVTKATIFQTPMYVMRLPGGGGNHINVAQKVYMRAKLPIDEIALKSIIEEKVRKNKYRSGLTISFSFDAVVEPSIDQQNRVSFLIREVPIGRVISIS